MKKPLNWVSEKEAIEVLRIDKRILDLFREEGYFKPGTHWRSSPDAKHLPWNPKVVYQISCCREVIEYMKKENSLIGQMAA